MANNHHKHGKRSRMPEGAIKRTGYGYVRYGYDGRKERHYNTRRAGW